MIGSVESRRQCQRPRHERCSGTVWWVSHGRRESSGAPVRCGGNRVFVLNSINSENKAYSYECVMKNCRVLDNYPARWPFVCANAPTQLMNDNSTRYHCGRSRSIGTRLARPMSPPARPPAGTPTPQLHYVSPQIATPNQRERSSARQCANFRRDSAAQSDENDLQIY